MNHGGEPPPDDDIIDAALCFSLIGQNNIFFGVCERIHAAGSFIGDV